MPPGGTRFLRAAASELAAAALLFGCGPEPPEYAPIRAAAANEVACTDEDGDGHGDGCAAGLDCDDTDPDVTDCADTVLPCTEGDARACQVTLGVHDGVKSCVIGVETCAGGQWGPCTADRF